MSRAPPRQDLCYLAKVYNFGSLLGLTPFYDFQRRALANPPFGKIYSAAILTFLISGTAYSLYKRHENMYRDFTVTDLALDHFNAFFLMTTCVCAVFKANFMHQKRWSKLVELYRVFDVILRESGRQQNGGRYLWFVIAQLTTIICYVYTLFIWTKLKGSVIVHTHSLHEICCYYEFFIEFLMCALIASLKRRYRQLNDFLKVKVLKTPCFFVKVLMPDQPLDKLVDLESLVDVLEEIVYIFNRIFGWSLVLLTVRIIAQLLTWLNYLMSNYEVGKLDFERDLLVVTLFRSLLMLVWFGSVLVSCGDVEEEGEKLAFLCRQLRKRVAGGKEKAKVEDLVERVTKNRLSFTAAGFFGINKSALFSILGTSVTYFIFLVQLKGYTDKVATHKVA